MGAIAEPSQRGGKRSLASDVNLVPYIDMLMTIMSFLMISTAWTRVAALEVQAPSSTTTTATTPEPTTALRVMIGGRGIVVGEGPDSVHFSSGDWPGVGRELARLHHERAEQGLEIEVEDGVRTNDVARIVDAGAAAGIRSIQITARGGAARER